jgi:hypothetical protein
MVLVLHVVIGNLTMGLAGFPALINRLPVSLGAVLILNACPRTHIAAQTGLSAARRRWLFDQTRSRNDWCWDTQIDMVE